MLGLPLYNGILIYSNVGIVMGQHQKWRLECRVPSGNDEHSYGKSPVQLVDPIINGHFPFRYVSHYRRVNRNGIKWVFPWKSRSFTENN